MRGATGCFIGPRFVQNGKKIALFLGLDSVLERVPFGHARKKGWGAQLGRAGPLATWAGAGGEKKLDLGRLGHQAESTGEFFLFFFLFFILFLFKAFSKRAFEHKVNKIK